jgi:hypothetical protein
LFIKINTHVYKRVNHSEPVFALFRKLILFIFLVVYCDIFSKALFLFKYIQSFFFKVGTWLWAFKTDFLVRFEKNISALLSTGWRVKKCHSTQPRIWIELTFSRVHVSVLLFRCVEFPMSKFTLVLSLHKYCEL